MRPGDHLTLLADQLDERGHGVAVVDGVEVHVTGLVPGEAGTVRVDHVSRHHPRAAAHLVSRDGPPSPARRKPRCAAYGRCGGCAWQALDYPAQLAQKRGRVVAALAGLAESTEVPPVVAAPAEYGYRNKGIYVVDRIDGVVALGAFAPGSHDFVELDGCQVVMPLVDELSRAAGSALAATGLAVYRQGAGVLRHVLVRASRADQALIALVTTSQAPRAVLATAAASLASDPRVVGVVWVKNDSHSGAVLSDDVEVLAGRATVAERIAEVAVELGATAFAQVNLDAAERMYRDLAAACRVGAGTRAIDLYCGVGGIAFSLARAGAEVLGIERNPAATAAASAAAEHAGLASRTRFVAGEASQLLALAGSRGADLLVVNPPRKGLDAATRAAVVALAPARLAYVSCDPTSLARDLAELGRVFRVEWIQPYDLMPGSHPVETAVVLTLR